MKTTRTKRTPRTRYLPVKHAYLLSGLPNFSVTGSILGMRKLYYGPHAQLIRCGSWIYNATGSQNLAKIKNLST